jgi:hypothetical protein
MSSLSLNIISPSIRNRILSFKINENYASGQNPILYNSNTFIDSTPKKENYNPPLIRFFENTPSQNRGLEYFSTLDKRNDLYGFNIGEGYDGHVRRDLYDGQWDKRKTSFEDRIPEIYRQTDIPSDVLKDLRGQTQNSPYRIRQSDNINGYIEYTNHILGRSTPTGIDGPTTSSSAGYNILAAIVRGDGVGLALNPSDHGIKVVTDLDIKQTLGGRIYSQMSGQETPLGRFGLKAAAVSMANQMMAKTGQFVSGAVKETGRWIASNTIGRLFGGDGSDFDLNAFGSSRITNPPGFMDDILNATGLNRGINALAGGLGLDFLLDNNNWTQTATSANDGKYVTLDPDLLADTLGSDQPNFDRFVRPQGRPGRAFDNAEEDDGGRNFFKRLFGGKESRKREVVNEWEFRRLQQDMLVQWTGAMNARMIHTLLGLNKYSPGYTDKNSRRANRRGVPLERKGYDALFPDNQYINQPSAGLRAVAEYRKIGEGEGNELDKVSITKTSGGNVWEYSTITWGESNASSILEAASDEDEKEERKGLFTRMRENRQQRQRNRDGKSFKDRWNERREARRNQDETPAVIGSDINGPYTLPFGGGVFLIRGVNETNRNNADTLLEKTAALFAANKIGTMVSRFQKKGEQPSFIQSAVHPVHGMSKGRMLANKGLHITNTDGGYTDPWCRVWTAESQHRTLLNAIRPFVVDDKENPDPGNKGRFMTMKELHGRIEHIRPYLDQFVNYTSLQDNGLPKIAPYRSDFDGYEYSEGNRYKYNRKYMFSIENLAWKGLKLERLLCPSQIGPNGGRIYWFSPLNLTFGETITSTVQDVSVIGRGEPMYTFRGNTKREGDLTFTMIVDHSSFHEYMRGRVKDEVDSEGKMINEEEFHQSVLRFDAGCDIPEVIRPKTGKCRQKITANKKEPIVLEDILVDDKIETIKTEEIDLVTVYYPNDFSGVSWHMYHKSVVNAKELVSIRNGAGNKIMTYLYTGGGSNVSGEGPDESSVGGYEMKPKLDSDHKVSISNNKIPISSGTNSMTSLNDTSKTINGILDTQQTRPSSYKSDTDFIRDFRANMHVTDIIIPYYEAEGKYNPSRKVLPRERNTVLPRVQYEQFMSNWDIGNFELNSTKIGNNRFSFGGFYELCSDKKDGPHSNEITGEYDTKEKLVDLFNSAEKIQIFGNASSDGTSRDNKLLGKYRAISLAFFILENLPGIKLDDESDSGYIAPVWEIKDEVLMERATNERGFPSIKESKFFRHAHVKIIKKNSSTEDVQKKIGETSLEKSIKQVSDYVLTAKNTRYDEEMDFYDYVDKNDDLTWTKIRDRYNKYIPALWSCTPEGFNARLTFLQQCTRSGPTNVGGENVRGVANIANLAFGRPPVCILRIGDFIQSKVFIDSVSFKYGLEDKVQWDLNPEGIGIQPMCVNVTLKVKFMGGQDITGAIARLQNAVSFNYYANTSVYDDRSDGNKVNEETGNIEIDFSRQRGMVYTGGTRDTSTSENTTVTKIIDGERIVTNSSSLTKNYSEVLKKDDVGLKMMNDSISGLFDPYKYYNGNMYLDNMICPKDDEIKYSVPFATTPDKMKGTDMRDVRLPTAKHQIPMPDHIHRPS